jgi:hypothetical protein
MAYSFFFYRQYYGFCTQDDQKQNSAILYFLIKVPRPVDLGLQI